MNSGKKTDLQGAKHGDSRGLLRLPPYLGSKSTGPQSPSKPMRYRIVARAENAGGRMMTAYLERFHDVVTTASGPKPVDSHRRVGGNGEPLSSNTFRSQKSAKEIAVAMGFEVHRIIEPSRSRLEIALEATA
jgi:hypothetical protein